jgi:pimeloyl-ACP methyl ester carboxylesterase
MAAGEPMKPDALDGSPFHEAYVHVAPHPENWHQLVTKITRLDSAVGDWEPETIASLKPPALLIIGDSDIVRPEHVMDMFRLLGGGVVGDLVGLPRSQLAVLPGTTHVMVPERAEWLASMVLTFLDAPLPKSDTSGGGLS